VNAVRLQALDRLEIPVEEPDLLGAAEGGEDLALLRGHVALLVPEHPVESSEGQREYFHTF
jgi:hypothetical protein